MNFVTLDRTHMVNMVKTQYRYPRPLTFNDAFFAFQDPYAHRIQYMVVICNKVVEVALQMTVMIVMRTAAPYILVDIPFGIRVKVFLFQLYTL